MPLFNPPSSGATAAQISDATVPGKHLLTDAAAGAVAYYRENADGTISKLTAAQLLTALDIAPFDAGNKTGAATLTLSDGTKQKGASTGNITAFSITGGAEGNHLEFWLKAGGAHTFTTAYTLPSDSAVAFPKTLTSGKTYVMLFKFIDGAWRVVSIVGGY